MFTCSKISLLIQNSWVCWVCSMKINFGKISLGKTLIEHLQFPKSDNEGISSPGEVLLKTVALEHNNLQDIMGEQLI